MTACHGFLVTSPVTRLQTLRNNQIQRVAQGLSLSESEEALGGSIPQPDYAARVGNYEGIAEHLNQLLIVKVGSQSVHDIVRPGCNGSSLSRQHARRLVGQELCPSTRPPTFRGACAPGQCVIAAHAS